MLAPTVYPTYMRPITVARMRCGVNSAASAIPVETAPPSPIPASTRSDSSCVKLSANADVLNISGGTIAGNIVGQGTSNTINFAAGSGTFTYGSAFNFSTINQVNVSSGTAILDGTNSAAHVTVNGGALQIGDAGATLTEVVRGWRSHWPRTLPIPHPSPRNKAWIKRNPWFAEEVLPALRQRVADALGRQGSTGVDD